MSSDGGAGEAEVVWVVSEVAYGQSDIVSIHRTKQGAERKAAALTKADVEKWTVHDA